MLSSSILCLFAISCVVVKSIVCQDLEDAENEIFGVKTDNAAVQKAFEDTFGQKHYNLRAFGEDLKLVLRPNNQLFTANSEVIRRHNGKTLSRDKLANQGYHNGFLHSSPGSTVSVKVKDGYLSGIIVTDSHFMTIDGLRNNEYNTSDGNTPNHVITKRRHSENDLRKTLPVLRSLGAGTHTITKRSADTDVQYLEGMLVAHSSIIAFHGDFTPQFLVLVADLLNALYRDDTLGEIKVVYVLARAMLVTGDELDSVIHNIGDSTRLISFFKSWVNTLQNPDENSDDHFDHASLITKEICGTQSCSVNGRGYYGGMCGSYSTTTSVDLGIGTALVLAHEIGHTFDLGHDSGSCANGYIMSSGLHGSVNSYRWSPCSRSNIQVYLSNPERFKCLYDAPVFGNIKNVDGSSLGQRVTRDQQCKLMYGDNYGECGPFNDRCSLLYCRGAGSTSCYHHGVAPVEGTSCGLYKWCQSGYCVHEPIPDPIDGNWGAWSEFTNCTRNCGVGVRHRIRKCDSPAPQYYGEDCVGDSRGHFETCNTQVCSSGTPNFKLQQCKDNDGKFKYAQDAGCQLNCVAGGLISYYGTVKDGTRCTIDPSNYDVCVQGVCKNVGCDLKFSHKLNDRCGVCDGSGNTCKLINGTIVENLSSLKRGESKLFFIMPTGATNLDMRELFSTFNEIGVQDQNGTWLIRNGFTKTVYFAGSKIEYTRESSNSANALKISGPPLAEPLNIMAVKAFRWQITVQYSYYEPLSEPSDLGFVTFYWNSILLTCNHTCAGGWQETVGQCYRTDDDTPVNNDHCDANTHPFMISPCNTQPCNPRWYIGAWSHCSQKCGPDGNRTRTVECRQKYNSTYDKVVDDSQCSGTKEKASEECNIVDCSPDWVPGPWSDCSEKTCEGVLSRQLFCRKLLKTGTINHLTDHHCVTTRPVVEIVCNPGIRCHVWEPIYPNCTQCKEETSSTLTYTAVGCYYLKEDLFGAALGTVNVEPSHTHKTVENCGLLAWENARRMFAVGANGECYSSMDGHEKYHYGGQSSECVDHIGGNHSVFVYGINSKVLVSNHSCIYIEDNSVVNNTLCKDPKPNPVLKLCCEEVCMSYCFETVNGGYCSIPFVYEGKQNYECLRDDANKLWCATTSNYDKDGEKDYCKEPCRQKTIHGKCCSFPFIYRGRLRNSCVLCQGCDQPWCGLTSNYDRDKKGEPCAIESG